MKLNWNFQRGGVNSAQSTGVFFATANHLYLVSPPGNISSLQKAYLTGGGGVGGVGGGYSPNTWVGVYGTLNPILDQSIH